MEESTGSSGALMDGSAGSSGALMDGSAGSSGAPTTDVLSTTNRDPVKDPLYIESGQGAEIPVASTTSERLNEDGGVVKTNNTVNQDPDGALLESSPPTRKNHVFVSKSGRIWEIGEDVACLKSELKIKLGEAEALLKDGNGEDAGQILAMLRKSWKQIEANGRTVGYMRGVIRNSVSKGKASESAEPTSKPLPRSAAPLPMEKQVPVAPAAKAKPVDKPNSLDYEANESEWLWGDDDDKDEPADKATGSGLFDDDEVKETQEKAAPHAAITMPVQALTTAETQKPAKEDLRIEDDWAPDESREGAGDGPVDDDSDDPF